LTETKIVRIVKKIKDVVGMMTALGGSEGRKNSSESLGDDC